MPKPKPHHELTQLKKEWADRFKALIGHKITGVVYQDSDETNNCGWSAAALVIELDNGVRLWASADDEGNNAGAMFFEVPTTARIAGLSSDLAPVIRS